MTQSTSRHHHFVPELLLKPWLICSPKEQLELHGYWWNPRRMGLDCKRKGLNSFCFQLDLLTLKAHNRGRDALEKLFFGEIDTKGTTARDILVREGPARLTEDQRCDFARLLLSLDARRPCNVQKLRKNVADGFARELDADPEIRAAMVERGIDESPSNYAERELGWSLEDRALIIIQRLVDNPKVGGRLINAYWDLKTLDSQDGSLVLADRPLIRIHGYDSPGATWVLPLTPYAAFIATNHCVNREKLLRLTGQRFAKLTNIFSAHQAERFVFSIEESHKHWMCKYLRKSDP